MAEDNDAMAEEQIGSTLVFNIEHYADYEPFERVAEGIHERGNRKVVYKYDLDHEAEGTKLRVHTEYYLDGELKNESPSYGGGESYTVDDGVVNISGEELEQFIRANFEADPEITLTDQFESMVDES